uniref:alpha-amylase family glycosyl hydrolase n=1 Tax=uncultured Alistipes sp. TaxID=538949 RepID=UPI0025DA1F82
MLHSEWSYQAVIYEMNVRQLTREGTLRAAAGHLCLLHDAGFDAVWLMPIYPIGAEGRKGALGSYYSIRDYCAVNPELGTMADFDVFVAEAHRLGMKVLLDWVANHTARDARWLAEKPADWYERDAAGGAHRPGLNYLSLPVPVQPRGRGGPPPHRARTS